MSSIIDNISQAVKCMRKIAGLNQLELAQLAGVGKSSVFDIEHGKPTVQLQTIIKVCEVLNINIEIISPINRT